MKLAVFYQNVDRVNSPPATMWDPPPMDNEELAAQAQAMLNHIDDLDNPYVPYSNRSRLMRARELVKLLKQRGLPAVQAPEGFNQQFNQVRFDNVQPQENLASFADEMKSRIVHGMHLKGPPRVIFVYPDPILPEDLRTEEVMDPAVFPQHLD